MSAPPRLASRARGLVFAGCIVGAALAPTNATGRPSPSAAGPGNAAHDPDAQRFSNRAEQSPLVSVVPIGRAPTNAGGDKRIRLEAGYTIDPALGEPALPASLREGATPATPRAGRRSLLVYYANADPESTRRAILAAGGIVVAYVPEHAFLVRLDGGTDMSFGAPGAWVGAWQPAYKLSPRVERRGADVHTLNVLLFPDGDLQAAAATVRRAGGAVVLASDGRLNKLLRVRLPDAATEALARDPSVAWIEPFVAAEPLNDQAQGIVQTGTVGNRRVWDMGIKGEGQVVMTSDTGVNVGHDQFRDTTTISTFGNYPNHRKVIAYEKGASSDAIAFGDNGSYHGTHTACTAVGSDDPVSSSPLDGMAKNAKLWFADISGPTAGGLIITPPDLNDLYQSSYTGNAGGAARISSNSWGSPVSGAYTIDAYTVDQFMWSHPDYLLFFSNGNSGAASTVASPATAKNCVSVGASGNGATFENLLQSYSSRGPTEDGRLKPTLCAPGGTVYSATFGTDQYAGYSGTSMASPCAAGCAALIRQYLAEGWYPTGARVAGNAFVPSAALLKAMCVNSGNNTIATYGAPDDNVGWGRINADSVLYFAGDARRLLLVDQTAGLGHGQAIEYRINVVDGSTPLKATLCWTDFPGNPSAAVQLVNDLDLTVTNGAVTYLGSEFFNGFSVTGGTHDSRNVEEGVRVGSPTPGVWTVRVEGHDVPVGPQPFALVVTGGLGTTAGVLALDRATYGSASTVRLRVTDVNAGPTVGVTIASTTEPAGEAVTLTGGSGVFAGSIALSPFGGASGDGTLQVSNGDVITATYVDASPSATLVAHANVALETPIVTVVQASSAGSGAELVSWQTSVSADSRVYYGPTPALGSSTAVDPTAATRHAETITGLTTGQTYYYDVESRDLTGNATRDDNGGAHYRFTVDPRADILLVYDGVLFEHAERYSSAFETIGWTHDVWAGALSEAPRLGDASTGLRAYKAVWWQNGVEHYPPFTGAALDSITAYVQGGGRLALVGHDIGWANADPSSPYYTAARASWLQNTLHAQFLADPATWSGVTGVAGDPISGPYVGGASYMPFRDGAAGDEVSAQPGAGTASDDWISGDPTPDHCGFRWVSSTPLGTPGAGVWGGTPTRLATMFFEWSGMDPSLDPSPVREDVLQRTLVWLIGRDRPHATVGSPNGGETLTGASVSITWSESTSGGTSVANRVVEYSVDGGQSWITISSGAGPSPLTWNLTGVPNTTQARVRVRITDSGSPALSAQDASNGVFSIAHAGGDAVGPVVVAGSVHVSPDPVDNQQPATLTASITDLRTGGAPVTAAEWSLGASAATAGSGQAMSASFGAPTVNVTATLATAPFAPGQRTLWVRGRDALGNWGTAAALSVVVNGVSPTGAEPLPRDYALGPPSPNPAFGRTRLSIALPARGTIELSVYDVSGRRVRALADGVAEAGVHAVEWDLRNDAGRLVNAGLYYYRLAVAGRVFTRRLVALE